MVLIPVRVGPSSIHGLGLFPVVPLRAGTPIWRFEPGFDQRFSDAEASRWPEPARAHLRWFAWRERESGLWVLSGDHACFMNHAAVPNTGMAPGGPEGVTCALRDIVEGEELTCDYRAFDAEAEAKLRH